MNKHLHFLTMTGIILLLFSQFTFGQGYQSFFGRNSTSYSQFFTNEWSTYAANGEKSVHNSHSIVGQGYTFDSYFTKDDTVRINDILYYKTSYIPNTNTHAPESPDSYNGMWGGEEFDFYLREDTASGKLYYYCASSDKERLWCDMSLQVGDTFYCPLNVEYGGFGYFDAGTIYPYFVVDSIDYVNSKKIIYFSMSEWFSHIAIYYSDSKTYHRLQLKFIEGIGPLYGPATAKSFHYGGECHHTILLCLHKDDTLTFMTNPILGCEQEGYLPSNNIKEPKNLKLKLTLNQENTRLTIELPAELENKQGNIYIMDIVGCMLYNKALNSNSQVIDVSNFNSGVYIVSFQNKKYRFSNKFVKINNHH